MSRLLRRAPDGDKLRLSFAPHPACPEATMVNIWPWLILVTLYGAAVGSFLNVVVYRLPEGRSLVRPASHCPRCGHKLAWTDNVPVLGWLWLRGRCRYCRAPISVQYPLVEAATAGLFALVMGVYYLTGLRPGFAEAGLGGSWPVLVVHLVLVAGLVAATLIDFRLFIIPLEVPWVVTAAAVVGLPTAVGLGWVTPGPGAVLVPMASGPGVGAAIGGAAGLAVSLGLLQSGLLPRSFDEVGQEVTDPAPGDAFPAHPHPRREVLKELVFLLPPTAGVLLGAWWCASAAQSEPLPDYLAALGGVIGGYLVGGGLVWITRVLGTLVFGKEAMGLGDVHLLGAIGAVLGGVDAALVFFVAPFLGLGAVAVMVGMTAVAKGEVRVIPYGPYLAAAALVVMLYRRPLLGFFGIV